MSNKQAMRMHFHEGSSLGLMLSAWLYRIVIVWLTAAGVCKQQLLLTPSEQWAVIAACLILLLMMQRIYHACEFGYFRVTELVISQLLANAISTGVAYAAAALYTRNMFNPSDLLLNLLIQGLVSILWTNITQSIYLRRRRPPRTAIIYRNEEMLELLRCSPDFDTKYDVQALMSDPADAPQAVCDQIAECEGVFVAELNAALTNEIAAFCLTRDIIGYFAPDLGHIIMAGAKYSGKFNVPVMRAGRYREYLFLKRVLDIGMAVAGIVITLSDMLVTALAIRLEARYQ